MGSIKETAQQSDSRKHPSARRDKRRLVIVASLVLGAGVVLMAGAYARGHSEAVGVIRQNDQLSARAAEYSAKIKQQKDINSGSVPSGEAYKDPAGKIGLLDGKITMTLPKGWTRTPQDYCMGGSRDSVITCEDVAAVTPTDLTRPTDGFSWQVTLGVYDYATTDGSARNWYYAKYENMLPPSVDDSIDESVVPINGYDAYSAEYKVYSGDSKVVEPEYTQLHYAVVHGKYGVVIDAQVQAGAIYGAGAYDYRKKYEPIIKQMVQSIMFKE